MKPSLTSDYFAALYEQNPDPWHFATKEYEHQKYAATLQHLPRERYHQALELGCSIGVLSQQLGARAGQLLSLDTSQIALDQAKARCAALPHIRFERATLPAQFPPGAFDLVLMSEVGYYFSLPDLKALSEKILHALPPGGDLVLVHYLPAVPDYPLTGDEVHDFFGSLPGLQSLHGFRAPRYRFDSFRRQEAV